MQFLGARYPAEMGRFRRVEKLSSFRRAALATWRAPNDATVYGSLDVDVSAARAYLAQLSVASGVKVTLTHLVGKAVALALAERPDANVVVRRGRHLFQRDSVDIFFQVAFAGGEDLSGAKISGADRKSLTEIAQELAARTGNIRSQQGDRFARVQGLLEKTPAFLRGPSVAAMTYLTYDLGLDLSRLGIPYDQFGSAMVTNVGMFGVGRAFAPLVPMSRTPLIVTVGAVADAPVARDGEVVVRPMLPLTVTIDHRVLDGYQASRMAARFQEVLEHPEGL